MDEPAVNDLWPESVARAESALAALAVLNPGAAFGSNVPDAQIFNLRYRTVWAGAKKLYEDGKGVDLVTLATELERDGRLDAIGGYAWLAKLLMQSPDEALADRYAEIVKDGHVGRELRRLASEIPAALAGGASVQDVSDRLRSFVDRVEDSTPAQSVSLMDAVAEEYGRIAADLERMAKGQAAESGLPSGLGLERFVPGGIPRDRLTLIFGETGTYKTAIKQWISDTVAASGKYVLDFTLEDSAELTAQRFLARHTGIPYGRIAARELTDAEVKRLQELLPLAKQVAERTIVVGNVPATIEEAVRLSRYWARRVPLAAVFVDYVQLLEPSQNARENEAKALLEVCKKAQRAAHRDKLAWVLVSQINRDHRHREDKRPVLNDIYGGSAVQHTTKLAIGVYRPSAHEPEPSGENPWLAMYTNAVDGKKKYADALELWIRKSVAGETNVFCPVLVDRPTGKMTIVTPEQL